ncbi:hypothetical protein FNV43_RR24502 [Rhamnella rubrinervis]|uniref:Uncharacterized protein n=1 Tax=Rhamnella rubrinervis TaxID=2594499 RepID=A0A8K0DLW0_9ROSA|nr:hypothetical protein FNV43_RR24502 [Rhamnella rubrinervis]
MAPSKRRLVKASEKQEVKPYWHGFQTPCEIAEIQVESLHDCRYGVLKPFLFSPQLDLVANIMDPIGYRYTIKNEPQPTKKELQQTYMKTFWHRPSDRKYYGPPVFRVEASKSQLPVLPPLAIEGTKNASQSEFQHTSRLEMQIEEIRSELPLSNMPVVPVWDPYTLIDPIERAALSAFIDDPSTTVHPGDYDALEKSSFQLILTSGSWLEMDATLFYIRRRMINSPQMYDQRVIVTDCMFWSSIHARYIKYLKEDELFDTTDWEKEMKDSPFDMYALGTLPIGSKSWLEVDYG